MSRGLHFSSWCGVSIQASLRLQPRDFLLPVTAGLFDHFISATHAEGKKDGEEERAAFIRTGGGMAAEKGDISSVK